MVAHNIIKSSRICKEASQFKKITCVFYSYSMVMEGRPRVFAKLGNNGFQGLGKVLDSPYVDSICGTTNYGYRRGGEPGVFNSGYNGSYRLHKKLYWDEADIRTHFYKKKLYRTRNMKETISVLQRTFGYALTKGTAMWWFLIVGNAIFHDENIMESVAKMKRLGDQSMNFDKSPVAQAALIIDEKSMDFTSYAGNTMISKLIWGCYLDAAVSGAPFDVYLRKDLLNKEMPDYKLYIFANSFFYDEQIDKAVKDKLSVNNAIAVWCYAPGYISGNVFSEKTMEKITGIKIKRTPDIDTIKLNINKKINSPIIAQCQKDGFRPYSIKPTFCVDDPDAKALGHSKGKVIFAIKNMGTWKSVYCMVPLDKRLLKGLLDYAGIHVYIRNYDVLCANKSYIMLHSGVSGKKEILLPEKCDVTEILSGKNMGKSISRFEDEIDAPATKIYRLNK